MTTWVLKGVGNTYKQCRNLSLIITATRGGTVTRTTIVNGQASNTSNIHNGTFTWKPAPNVSEHYWIGNSLSLSINGGEDHTLQPGVYALHVAQDCSAIQVERETPTQEEKVGWPWLWWVAILVVIIIIIAVVLAVHYNQVWYDYINTRPAFMTRSLKSEI